MIITVQNLTPIGNYDQDTLDLVEFTCSDFYAWRVTEEAYAFQAATPEALAFLSSHLAQAYQGCLVVPASALGTVFEALDDLELLVHLIT